MFNFAKKIFNTKKHKYSIVSKLGTTTLTDF